jgi:hypothetical protein
MKFLWFMLKNIAKNIACTLLVVVLLPLFPLLLIAEWVLEQHTKWELENRE